MGIKKPWFKFEEENKTNWQLLHLVNLHTGGTNGGRSGNYNATHFCEAINCKLEFHFQLELCSHTTMFEPELRNKQNIAHILYVSFQFCQFVTFCI